MVVADGGGQCESLGYSVNDEHVCVSHSTLTFYSHSQDCHQQWMATDINADKLAFFIVQGYCPTSNHCTFTHTHFGVLHCKQWSNIITIHYTRLYPLHHYSTHFFACLFVSVLKQGSNWKNSFYIKEYMTLVHLMNMYVR